MRKKTIPNKHKLILNCTRLTINSQIQQETRQLLSCPINWDKTIELAFAQEALPFLYYNLNKSGFQNIIPQHIFETMKAHYYANMNRNFRIEKEISGLIEKANHEKISIIPLRGFIMIHTLYRNPALRTMEDVDILIKQDQFHKIKDILYKLGYKKSPATPSEGSSLKYQNVVFSKRLSSNLNMLLDVHGVLFPSRPYPIALPVWERAQEININNQKILCLSQEDAFLCMALHLRKHTRQLRLKFIVDTAELLNTKQDTFDWVYINKSARDNRIVSPVYLTFYLSKELLGAAVPLEILKRFRPNIIKRALIYSTINRYNFFSLKKWRGVFLRLLLFDRPIDILLYLWRVSFLERFIDGRLLKKNIIKNTPKKTNEIIKK